MFGVVNAWQQYMLCVCPSSIINGDHFLFPLHYIISLMKFYTVHILRRHSHLPCVVYTLFLMTLISHLNFTSIATYKIETNFISCSNLYLLLVDNNLGLFSEMMDNRAIETEMYWSNSKCYVYMKYNKFHCEDIWNICWRCWPCIKHGTNK